MRRVAMLLMRLINRRLESRTTIISIILVFITFIVISLLILSLNTQNVHIVDDQESVRSFQSINVHHHHHDNAVVYVYNSSLVMEEHGQDHREHPLAFHTIAMRSGNPKILEAHGFEEFTKLCMEKQYGALHILPKASIIISFVENEELVDLLHTLHSIAQRTRPQLLKEIILIDDRSNKLVFHDTLQNYVESVFKIKFQLVRSVVRLGLIKARLLGAQVAVGDVLVFMDAHMEVQEDWLLPLLWEIHLNRATLASSYLDWMDNKHDGSWVYRHGGSTWMTYFEWNFAFGFQDTSSATKVKRLSDPTQPLVSPVTVGGMLAIDRNYFYEIGAFDDGMDLWGGENLDLAVRVWLFGGRVVNVPCSHVAHLERNGHRDYRREFGNIFIKNYRRFADVWMDDFSKFFYLFQPTAREMHPGNLTSRLALRKKAKHGFRWYLDNIFPELNIPDEDIFAWGKIRHIKSGLCLASQHPRPLLLLDCNLLPENLIFSWKTSGELRSSMHVFEVLSPNKEPKLAKTEYTQHHSLHTASKWLHWQAGPLMLYPHSLCVDQLNDTDEVTVASCDMKSNSQRWEFEDYTAEFLEWSKGGPVQQAVPVPLVSAMASYISWADTVFKARTTSKYFHTRRPPTTTKPIV